MSLLADFQKFVSDTQSGSLYTSWVRSNPGEAARWYAFRDAVLAGQRPAAPTMLTPSGKGLIDAAVMYLDETAPTPPPPPLPPTSYDTATAGIVLPAFTPNSPVRMCKTTADIDREIASLSTLPATEYRKIICASGLTYTGELTWNTAKLPGSFTDPHVFWDWGTTKFVSAGAAAFYAPNFNNVLMQGGDFRCTNGPNIDIPKGSGFQWVGFYSHDSVAVGLALFTGFGTIGPFVLKGTLENNGLDLSFDPHTEKGTGTHACNAADDSHDFGDPVVQSVLALKILNQPTGAGIQLGQEDPTLRVQNLDLYFYVDTLGRALPGTTWNGYATSQVAGNALQLWGNAAFKNVRVKYAEGHTMMGRVIDTNGIENAPVDVVVEYARATDCCLSALIANSSLAQQPAPSSPYDPRHGVVYKDVD